MRTGTGILWRRVLGVLMFAPTMAAQARWWGRWRFDIAYLLWHTWYWYDWSRDGREWPTAAEAVRP